MTENNEEKEMRVPLVVVENTITDWKKKEISPQKRAELILRYRQEMGWSQRELARRTGISHSSIADWERPSVLSEKEYKTMKEENGLSDTEIYRQLRNNITSDKEVYIHKTSTDIMLTNFIKEVNHAISQKKFSKETIELIRTVKDKLNRLEMYVLNPKIGKAKSYQ